METKRLLLRPWTEKDAPMLFSLASEPEIGIRSGWAPHRSIEDSLKVIRTYYSNNRIWAIVLKQTEEIIGCIGYMTGNECNIETGNDEAEATYWIAKPYWNKGFCSEALGLLVDYCFREKGFRTLWCCFFTDNPASRRVMEKCGFKDTGRTQYCPFLYGGSKRPVRIMRLHNPYST